MATLKIDASDLLGKLHVAAIDKVNKEFSNKFKKLLKGGSIGNAVIDNTAFDDKNGKLNLNSSGKAQIVIRSEGVNAWNLACKMMTVYMKWFAGIQNFDLTKYVNENQGQDENEGAREQKKVGGSLGQRFKNAFVTQWTLPYELIATEKAAREVTDIGELTKRDKKDKDASSNDNGAWDMSESVNFDRVEANPWLNNHPFSTMFDKEPNQEKEQSKPMVKESTKKTSEKLVSAILKNENVKADKFLKSILEKKIANKVAQVSSELENKEEK